MLSIIISSVFALRRISDVSSWLTLRDTIGDSTDPLLITLSDEFSSSDYDAECLVNGKQIEIAGNGQLLDAMNGGRLFNVMNGGLLVVGDLSVENGFSTSGGAMRASAASTLNINKIKFRNCSTRSQFYGGAVAIFENSTANIRESEFAMNGNFDVQNGGAIYAGENSTINLHNSFLANNRANGNGGAISVSEATVNIFDTTIVDNEVTYNGGAVASYLGVVLIHGSVLSNNKAASGDGGCLNAKLSTATILNCTLSNNEARYNGGAVYVFQTVIEMQESNFVSNTANDGGAISALTTPQLLLRDCNLTSNNVVQLGGAVYCNSGTVSLEGSLLEWNVGAEGGALYTSGSVVTIDPTTIVRDNTEPEIVPAHSKDTA